MLINKQHPMAYSRSGCCASKLVGCRMHGFEGSPYTRYTMLASSSTPPRCSGRGCGSLKVRGGAQVDRARAARPSRLRAEPPAIVMTSKSQKRVARSGRHAHSVSQSVGVLRRYLEKGSLFDLWKSEGRGTKGRACARTSKSAFESKPPQTQKRREIMAALVGRLAGKARRGSPKNRKRHCYLTLSILTRCRVHRWPSSLVCTQTAAILF